MRQLAVVWLFTVGLLPSFSGAALGAGEDAVRKINVDAQPSDWILDESTGHVFIALSDKAEVVEVDPDAGEVRRFKVGEQTRQMVLKGRRLVVGVETGVSLYVINLESNEVEGRVALEGRGPSCMFCTRAENPYVYALCNTGDAWWDGEVFQVDIQQRKIRKRVPVQRWRQPHPASITPSANGEFLLIDGHGSPSRADLMAFDEDAFTFRDIFGYHHSFGQKTAGPANRYWMLGDQLFPLDLIADPNRPAHSFDYSGLRKYAGSPTLIHPKLNVVVSVVGGGFTSRSTTLRFQSFSEAKELAFVNLTGEPPSRRIDFRGDRATIQFDVQHNRLFYAAGPDAYVVDMSKVDLPDTPLVLMDMPTTVEAHVDEALRLPLHLSNRAIEPRTEFSLADPPQGVKVEDGHLVWTPGTDDVGRHRLRVTAKVDQAHDVLPLVISVSYPTFGLGVVPVKLSVDPSGKRALVLGAEPESEERRGPTGVREGVVLVLVDLDGPSVIATRTLTKAVGDVLLTDTGAYVVGRDSGVVDALSLADLSDQGKYAGTRAPKLISPALPGHIALEFDGGAIELVDGKTMKKVPLWGEEAAPGIEATILLPERDAPPAVEPLEDAVRMGPFVLDAKSGDPQMICATPAIPPLNSRPVRVAPSRWGRRLRGNALRTGGNTSLATLSGPSAIAADLPIAVTVRATGLSNPGAGPSIVRVAAELRDLIEGSIVHRMVLADLPGRAPERFYPGSSGPLVAVAGGRVVTNFQQTLIVAPIPEAVVKQLREPLRFVPKTSPLQVAVGEPAVVEVTARGGNGKLTYAANTALDGVTVDADTGRTTLDTKRLWESFLQGLENNRAWVRVARGGPDIVSHTQQAYEKLTRQKTDAFPVTVNLDLKVTDEDSVSAYLPAKVLLLGPADDITAVLAKLAPKEPEEIVKRPVPPEASSVDQPAGEDVAMNARGAEMLPVLAGKTESIARDLSDMRRQLAQVTDMDKRLSKLESRLERVRDEMTSASEAVQSANDSLDEMQGDTDRHDTYLALALGALAALFVGGLALFLFVVFSLRPKHRPEE